MIAAAAGWLATVLWPAVWGNLAASVLWVPVTLVGQHLVVRYHARKLHARLDRHGVSR